MKLKKYISWLRNYETCRARKEDHINFPDTFYFPFLHFIKHPSKEKKSRDLKIKPNSMENIERGFSYNKAKFILAFGGEKWLS